MTSHLLLYLLELLMVLPQIPYTSQPAHRLVLMIPALTLDLNQSDLLEVDTLELATLLMVTSL